MRKGIFIVGVVVVILGGILLAIGFATASESTTLPIATIGAEKITPPLVGSGTVTFAWSSAPSTFQVKIYQCANSACQNGSLVADGHGSSGSTSFTASGGQAYVAWGAGTSSAVPITISVSGLTGVILLGLVIAAIGALVAVAGFAMKSKVPVMAAASLTPATDSSGGSPAAANTYVAPRPQRGPVDETAVSPHYFQSTVGEELYGTATTDAPAAAGGPRPWIKCKSCGTMNEMWLHNCRGCQRALESTG